MNRIVLSIAVLFLATSAMACGDGATFTSTNQGGKKTGLFLSESDFLSSPGWSPSAEEPPLSAGRAITLALEWARRANERYDGVAFGGLRLVEYRCYSSPSYWYYLVDYIPTIDGNKVNGASSFVAVLFDGSVVGAKEIQE